MSISGIESSTMSTQAAELFAKMRERQQNNSNEEFATSILDEKDSDEDGLLSLKEAGISENHFKLADADGDGFLTEEEIQSDLENHQKQMERMGQLSMLLQGQDGADITESIINDMDVDGDGLLSMEESGLSEELFGALDSDGDGMISSEDITISMQASTQTDPPMAPPVMDAPEAATETSENSGTSESSASSSSSETEEEYDTYDFNQDGVVTMDELRQAFSEGDTSLSNLFDEGENNSRSPLLRMAMQAYQAQTGDAYTPTTNAIA